MMKKYGKMYDEIEIAPGDQSVMSFVPPDTPYFFPERVRWSVQDSEGYRRDLRVGAVTVGGSPQMGINSLSMGNDRGKYTPSVSIMDLPDASGWSACSVPGLARELRMWVWNSDREKGVTAKICIEGYGVESLDERPPEHERSRRTLISSSEVMVPLRAWQKISVLPLTSPYFDVRRVRYHAFSERGCDVDLNVIGVFVGNRMVTGQMDIAGLLTGGDDVRGIPTSVLHDEKRWEDGMHIGLISTAGLGRELRFVVESPSYEGLARVSITCEGFAMSELKPKTKSSGGDITITAGKGSVFLK